jgi:hypothetical protein
MPPIAIALLPCQNSALGISFTLLHSNSEIRTDIIALMTAYAIVWTRRFAFDMIVQFQYFLRTYPHAKAATLAPGLVDSNAETLCQKNHLPPMVISTLAVQK